MTSEDLFDEIFARLFQIRSEINDATFRAAAGAALVAIGRTVLDEAEKRAARKESGVVVRFPLSRAIRSMTSGEGDRSA
jgi:hypothetical protein